MNVYLAGLAVVLISFFLGSPEKEVKAVGNPYPYDKLVFNMDKKVDDEWYVIKSQQDWEKYSMRVPIENVDYSKEMLVVLNDKEGRYDIDNVLLSKDELVVNRIIVTSNISVSLNRRATEDMGVKGISNELTPSPVKHIAVIFNKVKQVVLVNDVD